MSDVRDKKNGMEGHRFVTAEDLDKRLDKLPTRWEVRFLILFGLMGAQLLPAHDIANAAIKLLP